MKVHSIVQLTVSCFAKERLHAFHFFNNCPYVLSLAERLVLTVMNACQRRQDMTSHRSTNYSYLENIPRKRIVDTSYIFGQLTRAKMLYELWWVVQLLL